MLTKTESSGDGANSFLQELHSPGSDYIYYVSSSRFGVVPAKLSEIAVGRELFRVLLGLLIPRPST